MLLQYLKHNITHRRSVPCNSTRERGNAESWTCT